LAPAEEQETLTISLDPDGRLWVDVLTHFTDKSGRRDYNGADPFHLDVATDADAADGDGCRPVPAAK